MTTKYWIGNLEGISHQEQSPDGTLSGSRRSPRMVFKEPSDLTRAQFGEQCWAAIEKAADNGAFGDNYTSENIRESGDFELRLSLVDIPEKRDLDGKKGKTL